MSELKQKKQRQLRRVNRTRKRVESHATRPRLTVFRSNSRLYAQIIDDAKGVTLVSIHEKELETSGTMTKVQKAEKLGTALAKKAIAAKVTKVTFDKGSYRYHGRVQAFADGARAGGLEF